MVEFPLNASIIAFPAFDRLDLHVNILDELEQRFFRGEVKVHQSFVAQLKHRLIKSKW